ncbi:hypothetical protein [Desulforamulus ruminis]|uniref:Uncharacterized protein n=1 Tax=Desulforamulus ruminis (strain ATCC 23193 / DSM 2154 / NCIMB 8452 / DL) TaxID=696281 RepID=F6DTG8_DESRL|nr:hypothetical protein [Desulforamulus ruminis]AEG60030.1 hypothetical protein Desru_1766 [Desulforamulus ruminis DSM 2154]
MEQLPANILLPSLLIVVSLLSSAVGIIGYFLKDIKCNQERKDAKQDQVIEDIKNDFAEFKASLPHNYVLRDDFIRVSSGIELKIDRVSRDIGEINKGLAELIGGMSDNVSQRGT